MKRLIVAFALTVTGASSAAAESSRQLTLSEAVNLAVESAPDVAVLRAGVTIARARTNSASAQRLPKLRVEGNLLVWDRELALSFAPPGTPPEMASSTTIRDRVTSSVSASLVQPVSGLLVLNHLTNAERIGEKVAQSELQKAKLDAGQRAAEAYLRVLELSALSEVAEKAIDQVEAQLKRAHTLKTGGVLGQVDILRLESARDAAKQNALRASAGFRTARRALALAVGLDPGDVIATVDTLPSAPTASEGWSESTALASARLKRPELTTARQRANQASVGVKLARYPYYPNIVGLATYQHNEGAGTLQPKNSWFIGLNLQWDLWDWGKTANDVREANAKAAQAKIIADATSDQVDFDVRRRVEDAQTLYAMLDVARSGLAAAEEAYRIQTVRFEQGAATTTDALEAEFEVVRARSAFATARYDYFIGLSALARAVGESPAALLGGGR